MLPTMHRHDTYPCLLASQGESTDFSLIELDYDKLDWALDIILPAPGVSFGPRREES